MIQKTSRTAVAVTAAWVLAASGGTAEPDGGTAAGSVAESASAERADPPAADAVPPAARAFRDARADFLVASDGAFRTELDLAGSGLTTLGVFDLDAQRAQSTMTAETPAGTVVFETIGIGKTSFLRFVQTGFTQDSSCWMAVGAAGFEAASGMAAPSDATFGVPPAALVVALGRGESWDEPGRVVRGTTDLSALASSAGKLATTLQIDPASTDRARVDFLVDDGQVVGWRSTFGDVLDAVEETGGELSAAVLDSRSILEDVEIVAELEVRDGVDIVEPDPRKVLELDWTTATEPGAEAEFEAEFKACEAR